MSRLISVRSSSRLVASALAGVGVVAVLVKVSIGAGEARAVAVIPPAGELVGPVRVIDGDTIDLAGTRIRLEGIDAPETGQTCGRKWFGTWDCGNEATRVLVNLTEGRAVKCHGRSLDKYGRLLGVCYVNGLDINAEMVRRGMAWAFVKYSQSYVAVEAEARAVRAGIWQGNAEPAWVYRQHRWAEGAETAPSGCAIKGNVSRSGQIYHMPWSPWYDKVVMRAEKGARWFCSETEAQAAGWRPAMMR